MKIRIKSKAVAIFAALFLAGCGNSDEIERFGADVDAFCCIISDISYLIDCVDAESDNAVDELLEYIDQLDAEFQEFAELDFPEEFDYLEAVADEASEYMTVATESFRDAYTNESYDEEMFMAEYEYARQNEARAYKRIQIIITLLNGEDPVEAGLATASEE
ncbi:MAG: hypothetical protein LUG83_01505 [Lachnospiraceae bacterium]|nr:hypothetical protein [Lachnospiraceae bacterium]